jgi:hypothetical protein
MPAVVPGVLVPDAPVAPVDRPDVTRLRELVRDGLLALTTDGVDIARTARALDAATGAPCSVRPLSDLDPQGVIAGALDARRGETWLIRPDGHVAAVLRMATDVDLTTAVCRALAQPDQEPPAMG